MNCIKIVIKFNFVYYNVLWSSLLVKGFWNGTKVTIKLFMSVPLYCILWYSVTLARCARVLDAICSPMLYEQHVATSQLEMTSSNSEMQIVPEFAPSVHGLRIRNVVNSTKMFALRTWILWNVYCYNLLYPLF